MSVTATEVKTAVADNDVAAVQALRQHVERVRGQMAGVIVGMDDVIEQLMITLLCRGHAILEGVPGLAKTLMISTLSSMIGLSFKRIQFTPDLMPADITGTDVLEEDRTTGKRAFRFVQGPIFAHIVLADEINRTPPKTQAALLEAMQERQITVGGQTYPLPDPFFVLATQNPIEQEGTYPLPEAQLDRFLMKINVGYPTERDEIEIAKRATSEYTFTPERVLTADTILRMQELVRRVPTGEHVYLYAVRLVRATRPTAGKRGAAALAGNNGAAGGESLVGWGAGPRGVICVLLAAKARALLRGRFHATTEDVRAVALPVLRHRIVPTFNAEVQGKTSDDILHDVLSQIDGPGSR